MERIFKALLFFCVLCSCTVLLAQQPSYSALDKGLKINPDSILQLALKAKQSAPTEKKVYYASTIAKCYLQLGDIQKAKQIADSIVGTQPPQDVLLDLMNVQASVLLYSGDTEGSIAVFRTMRQKSHEFNDTTYLRKSTGNLAIIFTMLRQHDSTLKYISKAISIDEAVNDSAALAYDFNVLGATYLNLELYDQSIEELNKALLYKPKGMDLADVYQNLANCYYKLFRPDSSLYYSRMAYPLYEKAGSAKGLARSTNTIASALENKGEFDEALKYRKQSLELAQMLNDSNTISSALTGLSTIYYHQERYSEALKNAKLAYKYSLKNKNWQFAKNNAAQLVLIFGALNQPDSMEYYQQKQADFTRFTFEEDYSKQLSEVRGALELSEKEKQIAQRDLQIKTNQASINQYRFQITLLVGSLLLLIIGSGSYYLYFRSKQQQKLQAAIIEEKERGYEAVIRATEDERKRISKDLHDGIGQQLSALKLNLNHLISDLSDTKLKTALEKVASSFSKSADEVRSISHQMMPRALMENGLVEAVEDLLRSSFDLSPISYSFEHSLKQDRFSENIEVSVYRIVQELVNNCIKHSQATEVNVQLMQMKNRLVLLVEDNGVGLNVTSNEAGHGLLNIRNRIDMIHGKLNLEPSPNSGLLATISIPLNSDEG